MNELHEMTARQLKALIRERKVGVEELTRHFLNRMERYDPLLNCVAERSHSAIRQARKLDSQRTGRDSLLFGLPFLVKDNIDAAGLHTTAGSLALTNNLAADNAPVVENILRSGGILLGKTNMTEFANFTSHTMPNGFSSRGGFVKNAYDRNKDPGGSSTGSAVAVSAGFCSMAVGTDTSFSIVACAAENGITGFKPQTRSLSSKGILPLSKTLDSAGPLCKNLSDALLLYEGMLGKSLSPIQPTPPRQLRIAVNTFHREDISVNQRRRYEQLMENMRTDGTQFSEISQPYSPSQSIIMQCEFREGLESYLASSSAKRKTLREIIAFYKAAPQERMPYGISVLLEASQKSTRDPAYIDAMATRARLRAQALQELATFDACIMTGPTNIMHLTGLPSLALKLCTGEDNLPKGMILYGADQRRLLAAALTIESYCSPFSPPCLENQEAL